MIINEVKLSRGFLFLKEEVVLLTSDGKISLKERWDESLVKKLDKKLKGFKIESANDFSRLKNNLSDLGSEKYITLERAIFSSIKRLWRFFNPAVVQVPRPMSIVFKKDIGIRDFVVFSLNAKSFEGALNANRSVADYLAKKIKNPENIREEDILMLIKEAIDKEHELVDFEFRFGVVFNNFSGGKYNYSKESFDAKQQYEFVSKLIEKYGVCYVENPFKEEDLEMYNKLAEKYRKICLICINSKINEYSKPINNKVFNTLVAKFNDVSSFNTDVKFFKENKLNVIVDGDVAIMDIAVGLEIPLVKLSDDKIGNEAARRLGVIADEIVAAKKTQDI